MERCRTSRRSRLRTAHVGTPSEHVSVDCSQNTEEQLNSYLMKKRDVGTDCIFTLKYMFVIPQMHFSCENTFFIANMNFSHWISRTKWPCLTGACAQERDRLPARRDPHLHVAGRRGWRARLTSSDNFEGGFFHEKSCPQNDRCHEMRYFEDGFSKAVFKIDKIHNIDTKKSAAKRGETFRRFVRSCSQSDLRK